MPHKRLTAILTVLLSLFAFPALAHSGGGYGGGFIAGFAHPILGWDHVAAMVAVGLWGAFLGAPAIWILPVVFPLVMAVGAAAGIAGLPVPAVETGIALSAVVLGLMILLAVRPPIWIASVIVGTFAIFHGYAHGIELPSTVNAFAYAVGFVVSTGMLHLIGIAFGLLVKWPVGRVAVRGAGGVISLAGLAFLTGVA
ncbi:MAG: HupE/UreJ family protein [Rhizobiaceae bacterium]